MAEQSNVPLPESSPVLPIEALPVGSPDLNQSITISMYLKPRSSPQSLALPAEQSAKLAALTAHRAVEHADDIRAARAFAAQNGLVVESVEPGRRLVKLRGTLAQMQTAFGTTVSAHTYKGKTFHSHAGPLHLSQDMAGRVEAVLGLDTRPIAQPRSTFAPQALTSHLPNQVGALYGFPRSVTGSGQCIAILELGGGYFDSDNQLAFGAMGLAVPNIISVSVDGGKNNTNDIHNHVGEVALDIQVSGGNAPGAKIAVYFAPNTSQGFADAISQAAHDASNHPNVISISWGSAEANWAHGGTQTMTVMNSVLQDAAALGVSVFAASADHLGTDNLNNGRANVDFPASSPWIIGCGGTQIDTTGNAINSEVVWNDGANGWGTGGGISDYFAVPAFQANTPLPPSVNDGGKRRGVPDVAGNAASASPYTVVVGGSTEVWYGTSAVAPLWAGLTALLNQLAGSNLGFFLPTLYAASGSPLREILQGNNQPVGSPLGYSAGPKWNACTGLGVPTNLIAGPEQVVSLDGAGHVYELNTPDGTHWAGNNLSAIAGAQPAVSGSSLSGYEWPLGKSKQVAYLDDAGFVHELCVVAGSGWGHANRSAMTGAPLAAAGSKLSGYPWTNGRSKQVAYLDANGHVNELWVVAGSPWGHADLSQITNATPAAKGSSLSGFEWEAGQSKQVEYLDANGHVNELSIAAGGNWGHVDLSATTGAPAAAAGSSLSGYQWKKGRSKQVVYLDKAGHVHELFFPVETHWQHADLSALTGAPPAASGSALVGYEWSAGNSKQVVYLDGDGHVHELWVVQGGTWKHADLTADYQAPAAASGSALTGYEWATGISKQVMYLDNAGHVHQLRIASGGSWSHTDLTAATGGVPAVAGSSLSGYPWLVGIVVTS